MYIIENMLTPLKTLHKNVVGRIIFRIAENIQ